MEGGIAWHRAGSVREVHVYGNERGMVEMMSFLVD